MNNVLVIVSGPTASGKTRLAIEIASHYKTEIISADSRQFFKELNIGTAKPNINELETIKHHFINSHSIVESFNAGDFGIDASKVIERILENNNVAVMVGGSGLYIDAVLYGLDSFPEVSPEIRTGLNELFSKSGINELRNLLKEKDPVTYANIDLHNHRRMIRALEVSLSTGKSYSSFLGNKKVNHDYKTLFCCIEWPREILYERINKRVDKMISEGLESEAKKVHSYKNKNALRTVGYKEMFGYIEGKYSKEEAIELIKKNTRNYAKRQITWFKKYENMIQLPPENFSLVFEQIEKSLRNQ